MNKTTPYLEQLESDHFFQGLAKAHQQLFQGKGQRQCAERSSSLSWHLSLDDQPYKYSLKVKSKDQQLSTIFHLESPDLLWGYQLDGMFIDQNLDINRQAKHILTTLLANHQPTREVLRGPVSAKLGNWQYYCLQLGNHTACTIEESLYYSKRLIYQSQGPAGYLNQ